VPDTFQSRTPSNRAGRDTIVQVEHEMTQSPQRSLAHA